MSDWTSLEIERTRNERLARDHAELTLLRRKADLADRLVSAVLESQALAENSAPRLLANEIYALSAGEPPAPQTEGPIDVP